MSLSKPHPIWLSCGTNPYESHKAITAARMLSGIYLTDRLQRYWTHNNSGTCLLPGCAPTQSAGTLEHLLLDFQALHQTRQKLVSLCDKVYRESPSLSEIVLRIVNGKESSCSCSLYLTDPPYQQ